MSDVPTQLLVGGRWLAASTGETFATRDPATGRTLRHVAAASEADVDAAVVAATTAMRDPVWTDLPRTELAKLLWRLADLVEANADDLARLETRDNGQPYAVSRNVNIPGTVEHFRYYAGWTTKLEWR